MHRLSRDAVRKRLRIGFAVLKPYQKRAVGGRDAIIQEEVVEAMVHHLMGPERSEAVILEPDLADRGLGSAQRRGVWGEDEPHPHPDLPVTHD
jgi:hypothetical protein